MPHFLSMVMSGRRDEDADTAFNNLTIINFNYDRTLEHFLYSSLQLQYRLSEPRVRQIVQGLNLFRPYGTVGKLPWQEGGALPYGATAESQKILAAAQNILTYSEGITEQIRQQIQFGLERARTCVFLGFGFHIQNMNLLRVTTAAPWRRAYATAFGVRHENWRDMRHSIARVVGCQHEDMPIVIDWTANSLLTDMRPALMAASTM
jgi:hypothetical protein